VYVSLNPTEPYVIKVAFLLSCAVSFMCSGIVGITKNVGFVCFPVGVIIFFSAWVLADDRHFGQWARGFLACVLFAVALIPATCTAEKVANLMYGSENVRAEFVRMDGSDYYVQGKSEAVNAHTKASEYAAQERFLREAGLCIEKAVEFEQHYNRLICADGWGGSSCGCGGGRGCCSWHGGYGYCATSTTTETKKWIDGMTLSSHEGLARYGACGGNSGAILSEYRSKEAQLHGTEQRVHESEDAYAWLVGWRDGASTFPDFEDVVLKNKAHISKEKE